MTLTKHAKERFSERFPDEDLASCYVTAKPVGKKTKRRVKNSCRKHAHEWCGYNGKYLLRSRRNERVIFVMAPQSVVVTVLDYDMCLDQ